MFHHVQSLLGGPHTRVRADPLRVSGTPNRATGSSGKGRGGAAQQRGLGQFFKSSLKCLSCRRAIPGSSGDDRGLCDSCRGEEGAKRPPVLDSVPLLCGIEGLKNLLHFLLSFSLFCTILPLQDYLIASYFSLFRVPFYVVLTNTLSLLNVL